MKREDYVERLEERLSKVENQLSGHGIESEAPRAPSVAHTGRTENETPVSHLLKDSPGSLYEGSSSFTNHSVEAIEVAQRTVGSNISGAASSVGASLSDLDALLQPSSALPALENHQFSFNTDSRPLPTLEPLPVALVLSVVRRMKGMY